LSNIPIRKKKSFKSFINHFQIVMTRIFELFLKFISILILFELKMILIEII